MFYDRAKIHVAAGRGGNGAVSFRREKHVPRGGPDGGDGGRGGDVWMVADPQLRDLSPFGGRVHFKAGRGGHGSGQRRTGAAGEDAHLVVPLGTQIWDGERLLADLVRPGQRFLAARGGAGGRGNARFVGSTRQTPRFAELGEPGEERWLELSLKLMADAGLAGLPNAGKSSLLRRLSNARPKVADYPFTTIEPMLGVVEVPGTETAFTLADVPGLLEGASEGVGLGHEFLGHLERCRLILHVVDPTGYFGSDPVANFHTILEELEAHAPDLGSRPQLVVLNKFDLLTPDERTARLAEFGEVVQRLQESGHPAFSWNQEEADGALDRPVLGVSAATGEGLEDLRRTVGRLLAAGVATEEAGAPDLAQEDLAQPEALSPEVTPAEAEDGHVVLRPTGRTTTFDVHCEGGVWVVEGEEVEKLVLRFDLDNPEAARYLAERLEKMGVYGRLQDEGARPGDEVRIGSAEFEFQ